MRYGRLRRRGAAQVRPRDSPGLRQPGHGQPDPPPPPRPRRQAPLDPRPRRAARPDAGRAAAAVGHGQLVLRPSSDTYARLSTLASRTGPATAEAEEDRFSQVLAGALRGRWGQVGAAACVDAAEYALDPDGWALRAAARMQGVVRYAGPDKPWACDAAAESEAGPCRSPTMYLWVSLNKSIWAAVLNPHRRTQTHTDTGTDTHTQTHRHTDTDTLPPLLPTPPSPL